METVTSDQECQNKTVVERAQQSSLVLNFGSSTLTLELVTS